MAMARQDNIIHTARPTRELQHIRKNLFINLQRYEESNLSSTDAGRQQAHKDHRRQEVSPSVLEKLAQMAIIVACLQCYTWIWKTAGHAKQISGKRREIEDLLRNTQ
jgi:hypothetical protein